MRKRILQLLVPVLCTLVLFVGVAGTSHAASHRSAPAQRAIPYTCTGDSIVKDVYADKNFDDTAFSEAQIREDSCHDVRVAAISEIDAGCGILGYCATYTITAYLFNANTGAVLREIGPNYNVPEDGNYHLWESAFYHQCGVPMFAETLVEEGGTSNINDVVTPNFTAC